MNANLMKFVRDDSGQGLVEYALIIALVSIIAIGSMQLLGQNSCNTLSNASTQLS